MSWDEIFKSLAEEYGRPPQSDEVQQRILEIFNEAAATEIVVCKLQNPETSAA